MPIRVASGNGTEHGVTVEDLGYEATKLVSLL